MFGVLTMHLSRLVNHGHSFEGAEDLFNLLSEFPLQHSFYHLFKPQRKSLRIPAPTAVTELSNFHFTQYDQEQRIAKGKYHSLYGTDEIFKCDRIEGLKKISKRGKRL